MYTPLESSDFFPTPVAEPQKILVLSAIPGGLRLDQEIRNIEEAIERSTKRELFEICIRTAVRSQDIRRSIAEERPFIVHFCGHGMEDGSLLLEDDAGENKLVSPQGLASLFKLHADCVKCVVLNACYSVQLAESISQYIDYVIGMNQPIEDQAAIAFTQGFYDGLGFANPNNQNAFERAFDEGMVALQMEDLLQASVPVLKKLSNKNILEINSVITNQIITPVLDNDLGNNSSEQLNIKNLQTCIRPEGRYLNLEVLAQGGMATVYKAYDTVLERDVAIKVLERKGLEQYFDKSVKEAAQICDEPQFITIYNFDVNNDVHYYIMRFIEGENLRKRMINDYPQGFPVELVHKILLKVGNAIVRARKLGFTSGGSIRPSNILLHKYNEPFISAFNLCESFPTGKILQELERMSKESDEEEYLEELAYLLPEKFATYRHDFSLDKSDQYMLGLLAYELLTGEIPHTLESLEDLQQKKDKAFKKLTPITEKRPECPKKFEKVILRMVSLRPEERYETLQEAVDAIPHNVNINLNLAKESYARCTIQPNFNRQFFKSFYYKFTVELCPHAAKKFSSLETEDDWKRQHQSLKEAILLLFAYFELKGQEQDDLFLRQDEQDEPTILSWIAKTHSHKRRNITQDFYKPFVDSLIQTVIDFDPSCQGNPDYQELVKNAWLEVVEPGVKYMISKY
ncbi:protein kinase [Aetokthonos hydrillicola Thurmond2011]|jgi:serine/threonine protein kinase|uniref:non-specific serine/threonine protein kinase n=1 Tax=Aetokthonos hydrillicola Thurmond2011 TaxID=2712845 RepID=A0AAP5I6I5_9CYAN|nr:protein kinase [Aetokthonos hydrillicola]MBO3461847.1 protein kinase [Aetokthonos hydrillicola CCALA 1050]MBW4588879.1 protein kinase [Aetokthonos hydrillicola CCALA 1050]MDR9894073.1 protein kinase [Aetokthonos hydrillicola Thurmond2011]